MSSISLKNIWEQGRHFQTEDNEITKYNLKLYLDKYYYIIPNSSNTEILKKYLYEKKGKNNKGEKDNNAEKYLQDKIELDCSGIKNILESNLKATKERYSEVGYKVEDFSLKQNGRMVVGLGEADVKETTMTFHHTYGIPYIPGQAIKGNLRNYVISRCYDDEKEALEDENFKKVFGASLDERSQRGNVIFFDAFPVLNDNIRIKKDIMAVHHFSYYNVKNGKVKPPSEGSDIKLISFLTIENARFQFRIGYQSEELRNLEIKHRKEKKGKRVDEILKDALVDFGVGAKTSVGYGYFAGEY